LITERRPPFVLSFSLRLRRCFGQEPGRQGRFPFGRYVFTFTTGTYRPFPLSLIDQEGATAVLAFIFLTGHSLSPPPRSVRSNRIILHLPRLFVWLTGCRPDGLSDSTLPGQVDLYRFAVNNQLWTRKTLSRSKHRDITNDLPGLGKSRKI